MELTELYFHFENIRRMSDEIKQLYDRLEEKDNSDDAISLRSRYETIRLEMRRLLSHEYDVEEN